MDILKELFTLQDIEYKNFQCALMPTVPREKVIGVRTPALRKFAKSLDDETREAFMQNLPHEYYEEMNLHGMLICLMRDKDTVLAALDNFLPHIDNWATCDLLSPPIFKKHAAELHGHVMRWFASEHTYTKRFAICCLMRWYLSPEYIHSSLEAVASVSSEEYYINMAAAWFFATALAVDFSIVLPYINENKLPVWTHNKTISKACDSFRITAGQKDLLRTLRRK